MQGHVPPARPLLVMAPYAIAFGIAAIKLFPLGVGVPVSGCAGRHGSSAVRLGQAAVAAGVVHQRTG
jgi:hypothetical protein